MNKILKIIGFQVCKFVVGERLHAHRRLRAGLWFHKKATFKEIKTFLCNNKNYSIVSVKNKIIKAKEAPKRDYVFPTGERAVEYFGW